jgi:hypothetical protein
LSHGGDENDDDAEINLPAEKPYGRRRDSLAAPVAIAAEAEPGSVLVGQLLGPTRLPRIIGAMQSSAARARLLPGGLGEILVNGKKKSPEAGIARQIT